MGDNQSHGSHGADVSVRTPTTLTTTGTNSYVNSPASQTFVTAMESFAEDEGNSSGWPAVPPSNPPSSPGALRKKSTVDKKKLRRKTTKNGTITKTSNNDNDDVWGDGWS